MLADMSHAHASVANSLKPPLAIQHHGCRCAKMHDSSAVRQVSTPNHSQRVAAYNLEFPIADPATDMTQWQGLHCQLPYRLVQQLRPLPNTHKQT
jgi:hypothetical protein